MSIVINSRPVRDLFTDPIGKKCNWNAVHNPLVYTFTCSGIDSTSYYVVVEIYELTTALLLGKSTYKPFLNSAGTGGAVKADISHYVKAYLKNKYATPAGVNARDINNTVGFYIIIKEYTVDGLLNSTTDQTNPIYALNAAKQIGDLYGSNMGEYYPWNEDLGESRRAKFLTKFVQPRYFPGYPFTLSFIYANLSGVEIKRIEDKLDINSQHVSDTETQLDVTQVNAVNLLTLAGDYDPGIKFVNVSLKTGAALPETYTYLGYVEEGYTETI
jgi:hypothetical protein